MSEAPTDTGDRVLVGVDGSESSKEALREGARLAQALAVPLEAVTCWQDTFPFYGGFQIDIEELRAESERLLNATLSEVFGEQRPANLSTRVLRGRPTDRLIEESENAQMLVVGRRGIGGVLGMVMGSVSSALVSHAKCSVLVVRD